MSLKYRGVFGVCTCTAIGWLVGGPLGAVAGFSVGVLAAVAPEVIGGFLTLAVVATAALTTFEVGFEGGRPVSFVTSRPVALDMGRVSGIVLLCWMATQLIYRERLRIEGTGKSEPRGEVAEPPRLQKSSPELPYGGRLRRFGFLIAVFQRSADEDNNTSHVIKGSTWVSLGFALQAVTGLAFWALAANRFDQRTVGLASELFTSLQVVNFATTLGLPEMLARFGFARDRERLLRVAVAASFSASVIAATVFMSVVDNSSNEILTSAPAKAAIFAVVIAFSSLAALVDVRMMVIRKWKWVFWRLTLSGLARIPLVFIPSQRAPVGVFIALALPIAASAIIGLIALHRVEPAMLEDAAPSEPDAAAVTSPNGDIDAPHGVAPFRYAMVNWVAHLAANAPQFVLPVIVFQNVEPEKYASFFQAWAIAAFAFILPVTIGKVLLSESAQVSTTPPEPQSDLDKALGEADSDDADFSGEESTDLDDGLERNTRLALVLSVGSMALATLVSFVVAAVIPHVYGDGYADAGRVLPWIVAGGLPWAFTSVALANARARGDHLATIVMTAVTALAVLGSALVLVPRNALDGAITAWSIGNVVASLIAAVLVRGGRWRNVRPVDDDTADAVLVDA